MLFYARRTTKTQQQLLRMHSQPPARPTCPSLRRITFARYIITSLFDVFKGYPLGRPTLLPHLDERWDHVSQRTRRASHQPVSPTPLRGFNAFDH